MEYGKTVAFSFKSRGVKTFEFEDQGKLYLICLPGNMQVSSVASEGQC